MSKSTFAILIGLILLGFGLGGLLGLADRPPEPDPLPLTPVRDRSFHE